MKVTHHFIPDWKRSWRLLSVQINAAVSALAASVFAAAPGLVIEVLRSGPVERGAVAAMIAAAFILPHWLARVLRQKARACDHG